MTPLLRFKFLLLFGFMALVTKPVLATHSSASGEISYRWSPIPTDSNRYEINVSLFDVNTPSAGLSNTQLLCVSSTCFPDSIYSLSSIMPPPGMRNPSGPLHAWKVFGRDDCLSPNVYGSANSAYHYSGFVSLPGRCPEYRFSISGDMRIGSDNLNTNVSFFFIDAFLNNWDGPNSSPQFTGPAEVGLCLNPGSNGLQYFDQGAQDLDQDSIVFKLASPLAVSSYAGLCGPGTIVPHYAGFNASNPIPGNPGLQLNPADGLCSINPTQQGNYWVRFEVEDWRFKASQAQWVHVGTSVRDLYIRVSPLCRPFNPNSMNLSSSASSYGGRTSYSASQVDSIINSYGINQIARDTSYGAQIPFYDTVSCLESSLPFELDVALLKSSIDPTDFRLVGPDSVPIPIVAVNYSGTGLFTDSLELVLHQAFNQEGNYLLQLRQGNDGNVLITQCGGELPEFSSILIPVAGCPVPPSPPQYQLNQVTTRDDLNLMLHWTAGPELQDPQAGQLFQSWTIYESENFGPWQIEAQLGDPYARRYEKDFGGSTAEIDSRNYRYKIELEYDGKAWGKTRACGNILLAKNNTVSTAQGESLYLSWNRYICLPPERTDYYMQFAKYDGGIHPNWDRPVIVTDTNAVISIPKSAGSGLFAVRIYARDRMNRLLPSESNWVLHSISIDPSQFAGAATSWIIPKIITPNGDGLNDNFFFIIPPADAGVQQITLRIYDRSGQLQFEDLAYQNRNNANLGWNGVNMNGQNMANGTYFYLISYQDPNTGNNVQIPGSVTVRR